MVDRQIEDSKSHRYLSLKFTMLIEYVNGCSKSPPSPFYLLTFSHTLHRLCTCHRLTLNVVTTENFTSGKGWTETLTDSQLCWLREWDLNSRLQGYEPWLLPDCIIPPCSFFFILVADVGTAPTQDLRKVVATTATCSQPVSLPD